MKVYLILRMILACSSRLLFTIVYATSSSSLAEMISLILPSLETSTIPPYPLFSCSRTPSSSIISSGASLRHRDNILFIAILLAVVSGNIFPSPSYSRCACFPVERLAPRPQSLLLLR